MKLFSVALVKGWKIETSVDEHKYFAVPMGREDEKEKRETVIDY